MSESSQIDPLVDLERRWKEERSAQLTLHLAEEHRRQGNLERAVEVLRQGLEHHPTHVAARVALGRYLIEDGQSEVGAEALESVVEDDPTHLVANKLLVSACLATGDVSRARDRLTLYRTLNDADPEIEALEAAVAEKAAAEEKPQAAALTIDSSQASITGAEKGQDPFGAIWVPADQESYRSALLSEGIFQLPAAAEDGPREARVVVADEPEVPEATVTLGRLYLEQGHRQEAEKIFRAVLAREPENTDAHAGLREAQGASELKATDLVEREALEGADPLERKKLVLESYRSRIRTAGART